MRTQDSIAEGTGAARLCPWFAFSRLRRRGCQVGQSAPLSPPLWVLRFGTSRADLSIRPGSQLPDFFLKPVPASVGAAPAIISLPPGAASTAEVVHSLTASNSRLG